MNHMTCGQSYSDYMNEPQTTCLCCCMTSEDLDDDYLCPNCSEFKQIEKQYKNVIDPIKQTNNGRQS